MWSRIFTSSISASGNSFAGTNQFDFHVWMTPTRRPPGWTLCPKLLLLLGGRVRGRLLGRLVGGLGRGLGCLGLGLLGARLAGALRLGLLLGLRLLGGRLLGRLVGGLGRRLLDLGGGRRLRLGRGRR